MSALRVLSESPLPRETAVDGDGFIYDVETGEVVGHATVSERFEVVDRDSAEWALDVRSRIEADLVAVQARRRALLANLDAQVAALTRRLGWWERRFGPALVAFARSLLTGKSRTAQFDNGKVAFRKTAARKELVDPLAALEFARRWKPEAVQVKQWITLAGALEAIEAWERSEGSEWPLPGWIKEVSEGESVTVSTGVTEAAKGGAL